MSTPLFPAPLSNTAAAPAAGDPHLAALLRLAEAQAATDRRLAQITDTLDAIAAAQARRQPVVVEDVGMSFFSMVGFMVKWAVAAVPAAIILFVGFWVAMLFLAGFFASLLR